MLVTTELLNKMNACSNQVDLFKKLYPQGIDIPEDLTEAQKVYDEAGKAGLDIRWWLQETKLTGIARGWHPNGKPEYEFHYQNGKYHDPENRTAAMKKWYPDGKPEYERHYQDGKRQDPKDGTVAVRQWYPDGKPECEIYYQDGKRQDPKNKTMAMRFWSPDGRIECEHHYQEGIPIDTT